MAPARLACVFAALCFVDAVPTTDEKHHHHHHLHHLVVGCPGVSFHQVANWVVVKALERVGYTVYVHDQEPHRDMYPKFIAGEIDMVTGSDMPFNHAPWLWNHTDVFSVMGTVNEATDIVVGVPSYTGISSVSELVKAKDEFTPELLSLDEDTCPQCVMMGQTLADSLGYTLREISPAAFQEEVTERMSKEEKFAVSWYVPSYLQVLMAGLTNLKGDVDPWTRHNAGKVIVRNNIIAKLDDKTRSLLGAVFVGNAAISEMDVMVHQNGMDPQAAAEAWIETNHDMWESFFGKLSEPPSSFMV